MDNFKRIMGKNFIVEVVGDILIKMLPYTLTFIVLFSFSMCFTYGTNPTTSMFPKIEQGSGVVGFRYYANLSRGDVVQFTKGNNEKELVKRIIGLPGETIEFKNCQVFIDGELYVDTNTFSGEWSEDMKVVLTDDEYFIIGDNRSVSEDSRHYGPIDKTMIQSKIIYIFNIAKFLGK